MIIAVYVDDLNIIGTPEEFQKAANCLKLEFEMKEDIGHGLNRYFDILEAQWIWVYIILFRPSLDW